MRYLVMTTDPDTGLFMATDLMSYDKAQGWIVRFQANGRRAYLYTESGQLVTEEKLTNR